jgi:hypothetical protein
MDGIVWHWNLLYFVTFPLSRRSCEHSERESLAMRDFVRIFAVLFCGLALVPSGAHALALINKMALPPSDYMIAQSIYRGWALVGALVIFALIFTGWFSLMVRGESPAFWFALLAFLCLAATQFIFWVFTYPMNVLTENWSGALRNGAPAMGIFAFRERRPQSRRSILHHHGGHPPCDGDLME